MNTQSEFKGIQEVVLRSHELVIDAEGYILIQNFMEKEISSNYDNTSDVKIDWNYLMPVVDKIETFNTQVEIKLNSCYITTIGSTGYAQGSPLNYLSSASKIKVTYSAIIQYISWYNVNKRVRER